MAVAAKIINGELRFGTTDNAGVFTAYPIATLVDAATDGNLLITAGTITLGTAGTNATNVRGDFAVKADDGVTNKFTVDNNSGNTVVSGTLGVTGAVTLSSTLQVNGNSTLGDANTDATIINGSLDVKGPTGNGVLNSTTSTTFNLLNTPTTINFGNATGATLNIGNATGTTTINGNVNIIHGASGGNLTLKAFNSASSSIVKIQNSAGTEIANIGKTETGTENLFVSALGARSLYLQTNGNTRIAVDSTGKLALSGVSATPAVVDGTYLVYINGSTKVDGNTQINGTLDVTGSNNTTLGGDLAVNGGDITTAATTFNLVESAGATTVNFAGNSSVGLNIGHSAGTGPVSIRAPLTVQKGITVAANQNVVMSSGTGTFSQTYTNSSTSPADTDIRGITINRSGNVSGAESLKGVRVALTRSGSITHTGDINDYAGYFEVVGSVPNSGTGTSRAYAVYGKVAGTAEELYAGYFDGPTVSTGTVTINNGVLATTSSSASLFNTNATTLNIGNVATSVTIGAATGSTTVRNDLVVAGNLTVQGTTVTMDTATITSEDPIITVASGTTGTPASNFLSGIEVERGDQTNATVLWTELDTTWKLGLVGNTQAIATRQDNASMVGMAIPYWNDTAKRFDVEAAFTYNASTDTLTAVNTSVTDLTVGDDLNVNGGKINIGADTVVKTADTSNAVSNTISFVTGNVTTGANISAGSLILRTGTPQGSGTSNIQFFTGGRTAANTFALQIAKDNTFTVGNTGNTLITQVAPATQGTAGFQFTIEAGDANPPASAGSVSGGDLYLTSGQSVGVSYSSVILQTPTPAGGTGTTLNAVASRIAVNHLGLGFRDTSYWQYIKSASTGISADRTLTLNTNNADRTISLSGNISLAGTLTTAGALTTSGAYGITLTATNTTTLTLPTTGTLATLAGTETFTNKTLTAPKITASSFLADANGNEILAIPAIVTSAVNHIQISNAATTAAPRIDAVGDDANVNLDLAAKGTGDVRILTGSQLLVQDTTAATAYNTGSLIVSGGVGVAGALHVNNPITISNAGGLKLLESAGATYYTTLQSGDLAADRTLTLPNGTVGTYIATTGNATGVVDVANGGTNITSFTTYDMMYASAATTLAKLSVPATPDGEVLMVGVGAGQGLPRWAKVSGSNMSNVSSLNSASTIVQRTSTGKIEVGEIAIVTTGGIGSTGGLSVAGDATITGNLTVNGTTTTISSNTLTVGDNSIVLNNDVTSGTPTEDAGIEIRRGSSTSSFLTWNETGDRWTMTQEGGTAVLQAIAAREDAPSSNALAFWDATSKKFVTDSAVTRSGTGAITATATVGFVGNASTADAWKTARTISISAGTADSATAGVAAITSPSWSGSGNLAFGALTLQSHAYAGTAFGVADAAGKVGHVTVTANQGINITTGALALNFTSSGGSDANGTYGTAVTVARGDHTHKSAGISDATTNNTANMIVKREANGYFSGTRMGMGPVGAADKADIRWNDTASAIEFVIY